jgi:hypothetical protein
MPVRSKRNRRRDRKAELEAWKMYFASGYDFFNDLPDIGVETTQYGVPAEDLARDAWARLGAEFLRTWDDYIPQYGHHALRVFGEPANAR